jgi:hypothetical protein
VVLNKKARAEDVRAFFVGKKYDHFCQVIYIYKRVKGYKSVIQNTREAIQNIDGFIY